MTSVLDVYMYGIRAGELRRSSRTTITFTYDEPYRSADWATPLSLSMPLSQRQHRGAVVVAFLWGLLPDNLEVVARWARRFGVPRRDPMGLLAHVGQEVAGAVQLATPGGGTPEGGTSDGATPDGGIHGGAVETVDESWIAGRLRELRTDSTAWMPATDRGLFSLAGTQPKMALRFDGHDWSLSSGSDPTTHIIKPAVPGLIDHDINEHLCLAAAAGAGVRSAPSRVMRFEDERAIVVRRYDRLVDEAGTVTRVHQEDLCQALGVPPESKYQSDGGPGPESIVALLRRVDPIGRMELVPRFLDGLAVNWVLVGSDAHAKNYSLLLSGPQVRMAPLYDVASALPYPDLDLRRVRSAMKLGGTYDLDYITGSNWRRLAESTSQDPDALLERIADLCRRLPTAMASAVADDAVQELGSDLPERLCDRLTTRAAQCLNRLDDAGRA
jgi:serine/threonine-protein kinase HipA